MRLNFSYESEENNREGCKRLGTFYKNVLAKKH
jgi:2-aminoadipate transaminase